MIARFIYGSMDGKTEERPAFGKTHVVVDIATGIAETYVRSRPAYVRNDQGEVIEIVFKLEKTEKVDITTREVP